MKKCSKCKIQKPLTEFNKDKTKKDGLDNKCKTCKAQYYVQNKEKIAKQQVQYRSENREKILEQKAQYYAKRKSEQPSCVYQIKNLINNKVYIGETTRGELRWKDHLKCLRGNYHFNSSLQEDFNKYGEEVFEWSILKEFDSEDKDTLLLEEARTIQQHIDEGVELYNLALTIEQLKMLTENK